LVGVSSKPKKLVRQSADQKFFIFYTLVLLVQWQF